MSYSITNLKSDIISILHGTTSNKVNNFDALIRRAGRQLLEDIDPQETKRIVQMTTPLFGEIYDYAIPADVKGNKIIDIYAANRTYGNALNQTYGQRFDRLKTYGVNQQFNVQFNSSIKTIRIEDPSLPVPIVYDALTSDDDITGTATNISDDTVNFVTGNSSVRFDVTTGQYIEKTLDTPLDLTTHADQSSLLVYVYMPSAMTSVTLYWGHNIGNQYSRTVTASSDGTAFTTGWNLLRFDWSGATLSGTVDTSAMDYYRILFTTPSSMVGVRVNSLNSILGRFTNISYYSKYLYRDNSTGAYSEDFSDDSDLINLDTESFNLMTNLTAYYATQQVQGSGAGFDSEFFANEYKRGLDRYKSMYKSEVSLPQQPYYTPTKGGYWGGYNGYYGN